MKRVLLEPDGSGNAYGSGWYGYVDKDLRALRGSDVSAPFRTRFCGRFAGGLLPRTMRFANRPTFQQVFTFAAHRPR